jgi:hypothetical protein
MKRIIPLVSLILIVLIASAIIIYFVISGRKEQEDSNNDITESKQVLSTKDLIQPGGIEYLGAFKLPDTNSIEGSWLYSGSAATYYPQGDPIGPEDGYPGSLFATGHEQYQYVSEISIPRPIISNDKDVDELNEARTQQDFHDIRGDMFGELEIPRAGLEYIGKQGEQSFGKIYFTWGQHLQEFDAGASHGFFDINLENPNVHGPWSIKDRVKYETTDYLFEISDSWSEEKLPGMRLATGRYRDGGQGTQGPSLIALKTWDVDNPTEEAEIESVPLILYSSVYDDPSQERAMNDYAHCDAWNGGAWITSGTKQAVILVGVKSKGNCWYGYEDGTEWPLEPPYPAEREGERGWWSDNFVGQFIFYDPDDLTRVVEGELETWEVQPYASLDIDKYLYHIPEHEIRMMIGAFAYDRARGLLYLFEYLGDFESEKSLVHVFQIE